MLISDAGTVIRMAVDGIKRSGRSTQGVIVTRLREGEHVSTLAPVVGSDDDDSELVKTTSAAPAADATDDVFDDERLDDADEIGPAEDED